MHKTLIIFGLFVALATAATSQTTTSYFNRLVVAGTAVINGDTTLAGNILTGNANPQMILRETDAGTNAKVWRLLANDETFFVTLLDDGNANSQTALRISRSAGTMGALTWGVTQQLGLGGSASAPFYSVSGDSDTGMYFPAANQVGIATGGTLRSTWASTGQTNTVPFLAPDGSAGAPAFSFSGDTDTGFFRSGTGPRIGVAVGGTESISFRGNGYVTLDPAAMGVGAVKGAHLDIGRNSSGSGAAGCLGLQRRDGDVMYLYATSSYLLRYNINTDGCPTENNVGSHSGSVVGDQTSSLASKDLLGQPSDADLLDAVLKTPIYHFRYKDGRYNGETFTGIVTDFSPHFGKDHNRALNEINAVGYLVGAVRALEQRVAEMERQLQARE